MSDAATMTRRPPDTAVRMFFRKPKGLLILVLSGVGLLAALGTGPALVAPGLAAAMIAAAAMDALMMKYLQGEWKFPDGALLTGMIAGMILSPHERWEVPAVTSVLAIASKHLFRTRTANIFNPAALALLAACFIFNPGQDWWGAMSGMTPYALAVLIATGLFITDRVNKLPALLSFLGVYFLLFTLTAFLGNPGHVAEIYRAPDLQAVLFFGFFMVTDPPTSPPRAGDQLVFGVITAVAGYGVFELVGAVYFLLAGLLVANVWEAWRRVRSRPRRRREAVV